jgi:Family of unknown function (DUF5988)
MRPAILTGGPHDLRYRQAPASADKISLEFRGGREHFRHSGVSRTDSGEVAVHEWSYRTENAE